MTDIELTIKFFNIVHCDRLARNGGGVCLYINHKAQFTLYVSYSNQVCELLIVKAHSPVLYIVIIYHPPDCLLKEFQDIIDRLNTWINGLTSPLADIILMGGY